MTTQGVSELTKSRDEICAVGRSLFERRLTPGASGNISVRLSDGGMLMTPTNVSLGDLDPARLSLFDADGRFVEGDKPTKEAFLHTCMYCMRPREGAIVHLHSSSAVAVSMIEGLDPSDLLPPLTAYYVMRVGRLRLVPYFAPGDEALALAVKTESAAHHAILLANHGPVVAGSSLREAQYAIEELEETAGLYLKLEGRRFRALSPDQVEALSDRLTR